MRVVKAIIIAILMLAGIAGSALFVGQRSLIFPAPNAPVPESLGKGVEQIPLNIGYAYLALPFEPAGPAPLLVFAHGNAELAHWSLESFGYFRERGIAVLLLEYPGYGGAPGQPSANSIVESGLLAIAEATGREKIDGERVILYGRSIGGGVVSEIAMRRATAAVILESTFTSLKAIVADAGFPTVLLRDRFDNATAIAKLEVPVLLYHGTRDRIIPVSHSERLASLAKHATLVKADCGHNDCPRPWPQVICFLEAIGLFSGETPVA